MEPKHKNMIRKIMIPIAVAGVATVIGAYKHSQKLEEPSVTFCKVCDDTAVAVLTSYPRGPVIEVLAKVVDGCERCNRACGRPGWHRNSAHQEWVRLPYALWHYFARGELALSDGTKCKASVGIFNRVCERSFADIVGESYAGVVFEFASDGPTNQSLSPPMMTRCRQYYTSLGAAVSSAVYGPVRAPRVAKAELDSATVVGAWLTPRTVQIVQLECAVRSGAMYKLNIYFPIEVAPLVDVGTEGNLLPPGPMPVVDSHGDAPSDIIKDDIDEKVRTHVGYVVGPTKEGVTSYPAKDIRDFQLTVNTRLVKANKPKVGKYAPQGDFDFRFRFVGECMDQLVFSDDRMQRALDEINYTHIRDFINMTGEKFDAADFDLACEGNWTARRLISEIFIKNELTLATKCKRRIIVNAGPAAQIGAALQALVFEKCLYGPWGAFRGQSIKGKSASELHAAILKTLKAGNKQVTMDGSDFDASLGIDLRNVVENPTLRRILDFTECCAAEPNLHKYAQSRRENVKEKMVGTYMVDGGRKIFKFSTAGMRQSGDRLTSALNFYMELCLYATIMVRSKCVREWITLNVHRPNDNVTVTLTHGLRANIFIEGDDTHVTYHADGPKVADNWGKEYVNAGLDMKIDRWADKSEFCGHQFFKLDSGEWAHSPDLTRAFKGTIATRNDTDPHMVAALTAAARSAMSTTPTARDFFTFLARNHEKFVTTRAVDTETQRWCSLTLFGEIGQKVCIDALLEQGEAIYDARVQEEIFARYGFDASKIEMYAGEAETPEELVELLGQILTQ